MSYFSTGYINSDNNLTTSGYQGYQYLLIDASSNNVNITLSSDMLWNGQVFEFQRVDSVATNTCSLIAANGTTVNGSSSLNIPINSYCSIVYWNGDWKAMVLQSV